MKKITIICEKQMKMDKQLATFFHGWLMRQLDENFVVELHQTGTNPYTLFTKETATTVEFIIALLNQQAAEKISSRLLHSELHSFNLTSSTQKEFKIIEKNISELDEKDLADIFYRPEIIGNTFQIKFLTPTSFKSEGEYTLLPDLRLLLQSLMKKYSFAFEGNERVDRELLQELCATTRIISHRLSSDYYQIHRSFIPAFKGEIRIRCKGNQTIVNYLAMLLRFAEYSGVGIKTSMGMGAVQTRCERRKK